MQDTNGEDKDILPFWEQKSLLEMSVEEWESLCDGCGKCCLNKLEDWDTGEIYWTKVACKLLDGETCQCVDYENRFSSVVDCIQLTPDVVGALHWLPPTCAYRRLQEGKPLHSWHYLVCGDREAVHEAGVSVRGKTIPEGKMSPEQLEEYLVDWPMEIYLEEEGSDALENKK